jgi:hypothetical protein
MIGSYKMVANIPYNEMKEGKGNIIIFNPQTSIETYLKTAIFPPRTLKEVIFESSLENITIEQAERFFINGKEKLEKGLLKSSVHAVLVIW